MAIPKHRVGVNNLFFPSSILPSQLPQKEQQEQGQLDHSEIRQFNQRKVFFKQYWTFFKLHFHTIQAPDPTRSLLSVGFAWFNLACPVSQYLVIPDALMNLSNLLAPSIIEHLHCPSAQLYSLGTETLPMGTQMLDCSSYSLAPIFTRISPESQGGSEKEIVALDKLSSNQICNCNVLLVVMDRKK